jgi:hypothetical protein
MIAEIAARSESQSQSFGQNVRMAEDARRDVVDVLENGRGESLPRVQRNSEAVVR